MPTWLWWLQLPLGGKDRDVGPGVILKDAQILQVMRGKNKNNPIIGIYCWVYPCMDDGPLPQMICHSDDLLHGV